MDIHGLNPETNSFETVILRERVRDSIEKLGPLFSICRSQVEHIFKSIISSGHAVVLTDNQGIIIDFKVENQIEDLFKKHGLARGADWSESSEGTNGIGTALLEKRPLTIYRKQHFRLSNESLTCTGAPIFDVDGEVLALFDVSSVGRHDDPDIIAHTRVMLEMSARLISRRHFQEKFSDQWIIRFHHDPERIGLLEEGLLAVNETGEILAADNQALSHLNAENRSQLISKKVGDVFGRNFSNLIDANRNHSLFMNAGKSSPVNRDTHSLFAKLVEPVKPARTSRPERKIIIKRNPSDNEYCLDDIAGQDARMQSIVKKAKKMVNQDIPLLITGETGVGKDIFAKAFHKYSDRADKPFIAINCAALPASLIEGELFGYHAGAFTGAHPAGFKGRFLQANGGTVFLDEIGDMPLEIQTRLLRVLETRSVTPLGSEKTIDIDIQIISATNQDLNKLINEKKFRSDLYYRISGCDFHLPRLSERADLDHIIKALVPGLELHNDKCFSNTARKALLSYSWPGNIRELKNTLTIAVLLAENDRIEIEHLKLNTPVTEKQTKPLDLSEQEKSQIIKALDDARWNVTKAAQILDISRNTLHRKMRRLNISRIS